MTAQQSEIKKIIFLIALTNSPVNSTLTLNSGWKHPCESGDSSFEEEESDEELHRSDFGLPLLVLPNRLRAPVLVPPVYVPLREWRKKCKTRSEVTVRSLLCSPLLMHADVTH